MLQGHHCEGYFCEAAAQTFSFCCSYFSILNSIPSFRQPDSHSHLPVLPLLTSTELLLAVEAFASWSSCGGSSNSHHLPAVLPGDDVAAAIRRLAHVVTLTAVLTVIRHRLATSVAGLGATSVLGTVLTVASSSTTWRWKIIIGYRSLDEKSRKQLFQICRKSCSEDRSSKQKGGK